MWYRIPAVLNCTFLAQNCTRSMHAELRCTFGASEVLQLSPLMILTLYCIRQVESKGDDVTAAKTSQTTEMLLSNCAVRKCSTESSACSDTQNMTAVENVA